MSLAWNKIILRLAAFVLTLALPVICAGAELSQLKPADAQPVSSNSSNVVDTELVVDVIQPAKNAVEPKAETAKPADEKPKDAKAEGDKPKETEKPKAAENEKKDDDKKDAEKKDDKKPAELPLADIIPPAPTPTPEDIAKRKERSTEYQSLGEKFFSFPVTGSLLNRYRMRSGNGDHDEELSQFVTIDIGDKARQMATAHVDARVSEQLNKRGRNASSDVFTDLLDTYNSPVTARVYSAYVDFNKIPGLERLRVGRQFDYDTPEILQYDGMRFDTKPLEALRNLTFTLFGGVPIHHFEPSANGDWLAGMAAEATPWKHTKIRFDYIHIDDDLTSWNTNAPDPLDRSLFPKNGLRHDDLCSVSFWHQFKSPDVRMNGHLSVIDGQFRDAQIRTTYANNPCRLQVSGTYSIWWAPETQYVTEFDPYFETLRGLKPYQTGNIVVSKGWCEWLWMDVNATTRRLMDGERASLFNREFNRYSATLQTRDWLKKGLRLAVTGSRWDGQEGAPETSQVGGEVAYEWKKHLETSAGSDYALYKYDFFNQTEHDHVRSYYIRQRWKPTRWASLDAKYEFEQAKNIDYHTFQLQFRFDF